MALSGLGRHLNPAQFPRAHRGAIVRREQISRLAVAGDGSYLPTLRRGVEVPVSELSDAVSSSLQSLDLPAAVSQTRELSHPHAVNSY